MPKYANIESNNNRWYTFHCFEEATNISKNVKNIHNWSIVIHNFSVKFEFNWEKLLGKMAVLWILNYFFWSSWLEIKPSLLVTRSESQTKNALFWVGIILLQFVDEMLVNDIILLKVIRIWLNHLFPIKVWLVFFRIRN